MASTGKKPQVKRHACRQLPEIWGWFLQHNLTLPAADVGGALSMTIETALPELQGRQDFYRLIANELNASGLLAAELPGPINASYAVTRLTSEIGRQFVRFVSPRS